MTDSRSRTFDWSDPAEALTQARSAGTGLEALQAMIDGKIPPPPIAQLMGFTLVEVREGFAVFECEPAEFHYNPIGAVHGGLACTLLDSALGCAGHTTLAGRRRVHLDRPQRALPPPDHARVGSAARDGSGGQARPAGDLHRGRIDGCRRPRRRCRDEFAARSGAHRLASGPFGGARD